MALHSGFSDMLEGTIQVPCIKRQMPYQLSCCSVPWEMPFWKNYSPIVLVQEGVLLLLHRTSPQGSTSFNWHFDLGVLGSALRIPGWCQFPGFYSGSFGLLQGCTRSCVLVSICFYVLSSQLCLLFSWFLEENVANTKCHWQVSGLQYL